MCAVPCTTCECSVVLLLSAVVMAVVKLVHLNTQWRDIFICIVELF